MPVDHPSFLNSNASILDIFCIISGTILATPTVSETKDIIVNNILISLFKACTMNAKAISINPIIVLIFLILYLLL